MLCPVYSHPSCEHHDAGPGHPESPARWRAIRSAVLEADRAAWTESPPADLEAIRRVHSPAYLDAIAQIAESGGGRLDVDTVMNRSSWDAALGGAGAALAALGSALQGQPAFAAVRPPGHHALFDRAMGFCLIANAVVVVRAAQAQGAARALIVDWDVHHGNGTQALVEQDPSVRFISMHQWPHWPFTGAKSERGVGNVWNLPMRAGLPASEYVDTLWSAVITATTDWQPDVLVISSGFDSMSGDPLGGFTLEPEHYRSMVGRLRDRFARVPMVALLEGGYVPRRIAAGVVAVAEALAGPSPAA